MSVAATRRTAKTLIVLGSGGHTAEMVEIIRNLNKTKYTPRYYILATSDKMSEEKVRTVETSPGDYKFFKVFRSRQVKQSYFTSIFTTLFSIFACVPLLWSTRPNLVICNGPGTCVPICFVAAVFRMLRIQPDCKIVFVESYCRVKTLSLSGRILKYLTDLFVVQWPFLVNLDKKVMYFGRLT